MQVGMHYANFGHPGWEGLLVERLAETARIADQGGAAWVTAMDHFFQMEEMGGAAAPMLEGYTTMGYLAAVTERVRLGLLVTGATYRHPGLLAKTVTTLDRLSGGRAMLGLGAAWYEREHHALGVPFPPMAERFERLEETLQICLQMWSDDDGPYVGRHFRLEETICVPPPLARPHPRIMIGGAGERKTLRMVAQYAQTCNIYAESPERMAHKLEVLRGHCATLGTDYDAIEKTMISDLDPLADTDEFLRTMGEYADLGIGLVTLVPRGDDPVAWTTEVCDSVLPRMSEL
jgi:F420-dependent oxidoreductase-like protein